MPKPTPTLRQIAAKAGVHHTTLSRALRGHPEVSQAKAKELKALAKKMGYVPNPMLSALTAYRNGTRPPAFHSVIAWLNPTPENSYWRKYRTFREYYEYAAERATELGFRLEEISVPPNKSGAKRLTSILSARNISAAIVVPSPLVNTDLDEIDWQKLTAVRIGYTLTSPVLNTVVSNHHGAILLVIDELQKRGYTRMGLCMSREMDERSNLQWSAGFMRLQLELPKKDRIPHHIFNRYSHDKFCRWIDQTKPDSLIVVGDDLLPDSLKRHGLRTPEDIGLVTLVQPEDADTISGVTANSRGVGRAAVDFVVSMINRQERGIPDDPQILLINNTWIDQATLRPRLEDSVNHSSNARS